VAALRAANTTHTGCHVDTPPTSGGDPAALSAAASAAPSDAWAVACTERNAHRGSQR
jgi:hypothetical protein